MDQLIGDYKFQMDTSEIVLVEIGNYLQCYFQQCPINGYYAEL